MARDRAPAVWWRHSFMTFGLVVPAWPFFLGLCLAGRSTRLVEQVPEFLLIVVRAPVAGRWRAGRRRITRKARPHPRPKTQFAVQLAVQVEPFPARGAVGGAVPTVGADGAPVGPPTSTGGTLYLDEQFQGTLGDLRLH
jgi:hypothetical protein